MEPPISNEIDVCSQHTNDQTSALRSLAVSHLILARAPHQFYQIMSLHRLADAGRWPRPYALIPHPLRRSRSSINASTSVKVT